ASPSRGRGAQVSSPQPERSEPCIAGVDPIVTGRSLIHLVPVAVVEPLAVVDGCRAVPVVAVSQDLPSPPPLVAVPMAGTPPAYAGCLPTGRARGLGALAVLGMPRIAVEVVPAGMVGARDDVGGRRVFDRLRERLNRRKWCLGRGTGDGLV